MGTLILRISFRGSAMFSVEGDFSDLPPLDSAPPTAELGAEAKSPGAGRRRADSIPF